MLKNEVIKKLDILLKNKENLIFNNIIECLIGHFSLFEKEYIFELSIDKKSVSINIDNQGKYLFIDLGYTDLNLRYTYTEFYLFVKEIPFFEIKFILDNFIKGKYFLETSLNKECVVKQKLLFDNPKLEKYNQVDIYGSIFSFLRRKKITEVLSNRGYNWLE